MNSNNHNETNNLKARLENKIKMKRFRILIDNDLESAIVAHDNISNANGTPKNLSNIDLQFRNDAGDIEYNRHELASFIRNLIEFYEGDTVSTEMECLISSLEQREIVLSTDGDITCPPDLKAH